jgi:hypothetical protein
MGIPTYAVAVLVSALLLHVVAAADSPYKKIIHNVDP